MVGTWTLRKAVCAYLDHRAQVKTCFEQSMDHERYLYAFLISFTVTKNNSNVYFIFITLLVQNLIQHIKVSINVE